ncbi:MAG: diaminopimelate epimerase [Candidatus Kapaibacterium sp.]
MIIKVTYMSGAGNLFTVLDNRKYKFSFDELSALAVILCGSNDTNPMKTEGFIALEDAENNEFKAHFINPDGSSQMMCGNGARCAVLYASLNNFVSLRNLGKELHFIMAGKKYMSRMYENSIQVYFPPHNELYGNISINAAGLDITGTYINIGSDHFVAEKADIFPEPDSIKDFNLEITGREVRFHKQFEPAGVNFSIYRIAADNKIEMRTYERGVEAETGACGTGAISVALAAYSKGKIKFPVTITPTSGIPLTVNIIGEYPDKIEHIILAGNAKIIDKVELDVKLISPESEWIKK